jgi:hypothetical protein
MIRILLALLFFTGCSRERLTVYTDTVTYQKLASYLVGTPDPELYCPQIGQRLIISWQVPPCSIPSLFIRVRFRDLTQREIKADFDKRRGIYAVEHVDEEYEKHGAILAYSVELRDGDQLLEKVDHQLWTELITVGN